MGQNKMQIPVDFQNFKILTKLASWIQAFSQWFWIYLEAGIFRVDEIQSPNVQFLKFKYLSEFEVRHELFIVQ